MYLFIVIGFLILHYFIYALADFVNLRAINSQIPEEFNGYYDSDRYAKSQSYLRDNTIFDLLHSALTLSVLLACILSGLFNHLDLWVRTLSTNQIIAGLLFIGVFYFIFQIIDIPFSIYHTFVIEKKYGFNKTTPKTFFTDLLKSWMLSVIIGAGVLSIVLWFFLKAGTFAWVFCWMAVIIIEIFLVFVSPVVIMPLFNKFTPLADGELKAAIAAYAKSQNFTLKGIFTMDGSRRSAKANAFFTGFGKYRRVVLFDTLVAKHTVSELVSVLAHEVGHYKQKHIVKHIGLSILTSGLMLFILSFFINNRGLFDEFKMQEVSIYASLLFFSFLYTPIRLLFSILENIFSRRHEYSADRFAVRTYKQPQAFIEALKKLTVDNLSNLTPHPWKVFLEYSHPPVLQRIAKIRSWLNLNAPA